MFLRSKSYSERKVDEISGHLGALRARLEDLVETVAEMGEERGKGAARHARSAAHTAARSARHGAERGYELAAIRADEARVAAAKLTSERPALVVGIALGLGVLAGIALMRR
jgi:ElaB/YqjD/DUF883 family membrane-anchored ribosome-binding protein